MLRAESPACVQSFGMQKGKNNEGDTRETKIKIKIKFFFFFLFYR